MTSDWRDRLGERLHGEALRDAPMAQRTSIRVGGPADLLVRPANPDELAAALQFLAAEGVPWMTIGAGANTIVGDLGIRGCVFRLGPDFTEGKVEQDDTGATVTLPAGAPISRLLTVCRELRFVGAEFLAAVPGTMGGAAAMNAGTKAGSMQEILEAVEVATPEGARWLPAAELRLGYRASHLPAGGILTQVRVRVRKGDMEASLAAMEADRDYRRRTQPLQLPNCGSTFRNPPGDFAGRLIEAAGLKGRRIGNAAWSEQHANFLVNLGGATARDVVGLIELAQKEVLARSGARLELEAKLVGEFDRGPDGG